MARRQRLLVVVCGLLFLTGCRSATSSRTPRAGTGDIAFRLLWDTPDDLDLHVVDPGGEYLGWSMRRSESGGRLDIDCNGSPLEACKRPIENVFWPEGAAPEGDYLVWVVLQRSETPQSVRFQLQALEGHHVTWRTRGQLEGECAVNGPWEVQFARGAPPTVERVAEAEVAARLGDRELAGCPAPGREAERRDS